LRGQEDLLRVRREAHTIKLWEGAAVAGAVVGLTFLDEHVQRFIQSNRSEALDRMSSVVREFGEPEVYLTVSAGLAFSGLISNHTRLTLEGLRAVSAVAGAGVVTHVAKWSLGRERPDENTEAEDLDPFTFRDTAWPSGHAATAFALAASLSDGIDRAWATVLLYTAATGVAWSRVNDNRHWLSDVAGGALIGVTSAKLVSGRWRVLGLRPPAVLVGPRGVGVGFVVPLN
jgi:membrane-associated phospholipid phosphatase